MGRAQAPSLVAVMTLLVALAGCGSDGGEASARADTSAGSTPSDVPGVITPELDSIAVLGHSGATGTLSDPDDVGRDAHENSWATGDNPAVNSIYLRLLETHPAMKGHNYNFAVNGSRVVDLASQVKWMLTTTDPLPDVVIIQTIDNDMRCDGTDAENARAFGRVLDDLLSSLRRQIPGVQTFFVSQWASAELWTRWAGHHEAHVRANSGSGPCDVFTAGGDARPAGIRSTQRISNGYLDQIDRVCAAHAGCFTDGRALETMVPEDADVVPDLNHLSIAGHRKYAGIAWAVFPEEIKNRP